MASRRSLAFLLSVISCILFFGLDFFGLLSQYSLVEDADYSVSEPQILEMFRQWQIAHGKFYNTAEEAGKRFYQFKLNWKYVQENSFPGHELGLNAFADLGYDEFQKKFQPNMNLNIQPRHTVPGIKVSCQAPSAFDWRARGVVTPVRTQGSCNCCWAIAVAGAIESLHAITTGELINLSPQHIVDCDTTNGGCETGFVLQALEWVLVNGGIEAESNYPYTGVVGPCKNSKGVVSIGKYKSVQSSESGYKCAISKQPIIALMHGSGSGLEFYRGGIFEGEDCSPRPEDVNHAVLIVGYGSKDGKDYWIVKNSWGPSWGVDGYLLLRRGTDSKWPNGVCGINAFAFVPIK